jgi:hypothetical protein
MTADPRSIKTTRFKKKHQTNIEHAIYEETVSQSTWTTFSRLVMYNNKLVTKTWRSLIISRVIAAFLHTNYSLSLHTNYSLYIFVSLCIQITSAATCSHTVHFQAMRVLQVLPLNPGRQMHSAFFLLIGLHVAPLLHHIFAQGSRNESFTRIEC